MPAFGVPLCGRTGCSVRLVSAQPFRPNIVYLNSHDTGRLVEPYGFPAPAPNLCRLAEEGVVFREAFCAAPTCSASRAALVTGEHPHQNGLIGLVHRGFRLRHLDHHLAQLWRDEPGAA